MRNLFLILVLGNLGFAAWYLWIAEPVVDSRVERNADVPSIALVRELAESPTEPISVAAIVPPADNFEEIRAAEADLPITRCVGVGPFSELSRLEQALTILRGEGYEPTQRSEEGAVWLGHWIYLANITTQVQADALSTVLLEQGIADTYFDPTGAEGDVLSLGLFQEFERADAVRNKVLGLGFEPEMVDRTRPGTLYWADLTVESGEGLDLESLRTTGSNIGLEPRACDTSGDSL